MENSLRRFPGFQAAVRHPGVIAFIVAGLGVAGMLLVDHGPWSRPRVQSAEVATYRTTGEAARAAGAQVTPTIPKPAIEPKPAGPKTSAAINPVAPPL